MPENLVWGKKKMMVCRGEGEKGRAGLGRFTYGGCNTCSKVTLWTELPRGTPTGKETGQACGEYVESPEAQVVVFQTAKIVAHSLVLLVVQVSEGQVQTQPACTKHRERPVLTPYSLALPTNIKEPTCLLGEYWHRHWY